MTCETQTPYLLIVRPNGPSAWTWVVVSRETREIVAKAEITCISFRWTMERAEEDATRALETFLDRDQVEREVFDCSPANVAAYQKSTNKGEVREMNQRNQLQVQQNRKMSNVRELMERSKGQIAAALPNSCTPERMMRITATALQNTPELLDCDPLSLLASVMECSQLGLEPNSKLKHAHLVPFWNSKTKQKEVQAIPGYAGLIELATRSGKVTSINANVVYGKDQFEYEEGLAPRLVHVPSQDVDRGEVKGAYAVAQMTNGQTTHTMMWKAEIDKIRDGSPAGRSGPWKSHYDEMCKKTAIRRLCKTLPVSAVQQAVTLQERDPMQAASQGFAKLLDVTSAAPLDAIPQDPEPPVEPPQGDPPRKSRKKSPTPKPAPAPESTPFDNEEDGPSPSSVQMEEYHGMLTAADCMTDIDKYQSLMEADEVLTETHLSVLLKECDARREKIRGSRGSRSNKAGKA